jgi:hypothetical protein
VRFREAIEAEYTADIPNLVGRDLGPMRREDDLGSRGVAIDPVAPPTMFAEAQPHQDGLQIGDADVTVRAATEESLERTLGPSHTSHCRDENP